MKAFSTSARIGRENLDVDSALGRGTIVTVLLPLFELQRHSDLQPLGAS
jgi:hypothetical protein